MLNQFLASLHHWFTAPVSKSNSWLTYFWWGLSLVFASVYLIEAAQIAFSHPYVIQDDATQHVFWLLRQSDRQLFPNDLIADYYQSSAPVGYTLFYGLLARFGVDAILASKIVPILLGLLTTTWAYWLGIAIFPVPSAAFIATLSLNRWLLGTDMIVSATPRAFGPLFFLAFLLYLVERKQWFCWVAIALVGCFYPPLILLVGGILCLDCWRVRKRISPDPHKLWFNGIGLAIVAVIIALRLLSDSEFGSTITLQEARNLAEFAPGGRTAFFSDNRWHYWLEGMRSGLGVSLTFNQQGLEPKPLYLLNFYSCSVVLLLPLCRRYIQHFPLAVYLKPVVNRSNPKHQNSGIAVLIQMIVVSLALFITAHAILFTLYLPSRYGQGLFYAFAFLSAITVVIILDAILLKLRQWALSNTHSGKVKLSLSGTKSIGFKPSLALLGAIIVASLALSYPQIMWFNTRAIDSVQTNGYGYEVGTAVEIYQFFAQQPEDITIATISPEGDRLPSFARRSVMLAREQAQPYQLQYYNQIRQRAVDLIQAQWSDDVATVRQFIAKYKVDFWLVDVGAFEPEYFSNPDSKHSLWLRQFQPAAGEALHKLEQGVEPVLARNLERCGVVKTELLIVLEAQCLLGD